MDALIYLLIAIFFFLGILMLLRKITLWYLRLNDIIDRLDLMVAELKRISAIPNKGG